MVRFPKPNRALFLARVVVLAVFGVLAVLFPRSAAADPSTAHSLSVAVLAFDSDDVEEQADGLTGALRSRVRASQGWSLVETTQSLGMLTAALRCPAKPLPPDCEQRIADHIKSERFIFGYVTKGPQANQVTAEVHLFQKGKTDTVIKETYAENLKDQNDESLRKVAQKILDRLGGTAVGTLVVKMGNESGEVVVDGDKKVELKNGTARLELAPGSHSVEVVSSGVPKRNVLITAGKETLVELERGAPATAATSPGSEKPFPTRKVIGGGLAVLGAAAAVFAVINFTAYLDDQDKGEELQEQSKTNQAVIGLPAGSTAGDACGKTIPNEAPICAVDEDANRHSAIAIGAGIGGGLLLLGGAYLLFTDGGKSDSKAGKAKPFRALPTVGTSGGGFVLSGSF